jgi:hypothetical protein
MPTEASIERHSREIARNAGGHLIKLHHTVNGFPDRLLIVDGAVAFIEFKAPRGKTTPVQDYWLGQLRLLKQRVAVVNSVVAFRKVLTSTTEAGILALQQQETTDDPLDPA